MTIPVAAVLGVRDDKSVNADRKSDPDFEIDCTTETRALPPGSKQTGTLGELEKFDLDHVSDSYCEKLRDTLRNSTSIWDGSFGAVEVKEQRVDLLRKTRSIAQHPY